MRIHVSDIGLVVDLAEVKKEAEISGTGEIQGL